MKRFFGMLLVFFIMCSAYSVTADSAVDFSVMSDDDIRALVDSANVELVRRGNSALSDAQIYELDDFTFSIVGNWLYQEGENKFLVIGYDWKNTSSEPKSFGFALSESAYQNGLQIDTGLVFGLKTNMSTNALPGFGMISYTVFELTDDSDVTVYIDDMWDFGDDFQNIIYTVSLSDLEQFQN